ncbi:Eco29kI family restriction endonuclease [Qipengyuania sp. XHP0211]|uniref:Eco29kI family restriction endonuclease n=1 Tax=Qipengyuania sp. XHP0211 TaxID=3038079 RepID=UPI00241C521C|nr:Eco29kI family restriction endonuclease [Qipengyuania sp. XHP0211]MDG5750478.1 Eco29kI family restriction endonuclease [Qipengyuania sp. XHP0211]
MPRDPSIEKAAQLLAGIERLLESTRTGELTAPARKKLVASIDSMRDRLDRLTRKIDPNELPDAFFDPAEPTLIGNFVALALVAQDRRSLASLGRFYGSGVYAIYYNGGNPLYAPISGTETPIYVGKADPKGNPKTAIDQGTKLADRLNEHRRNIDKVNGVDIADFDCRALAVQTGYQAAAESHLIRMFRPIWNNETGILYGLGKHGDSATTRANNKSPFDTLHPGRRWADASPEAQSVPEIVDKVREHFDSAIVFDDQSAVLRAFVANIRREDRLDRDDEAAKRT